MKNKEIRRFLDNSCKGVLLDLMEDVGFNDTEKKLFKSRYIDFDLMHWTCLNVLFCADRTYNRIHSKVLAKVHSYLEWRNQGKI